MKKIFAKQLITLLMLGLLTACNGGSDGGSSSASADTQDTEATEAVDGNTSEVSEETEEEVIEEVEEETLSINLTGDLEYKYIPDYYGEEVGRYDFAFDADPEDLEGGTEVVFERCDKNDTDQSSCNIINTLLCETGGFCKAYDSNGTELSYYDASFFDQTGEVYKYYFLVNDIDDDLYQASPKYKVVMYLQSGGLTGPRHDVTDITE